MNATRPPFRADHVGSLLCPAQLLEARERARKAEISAAELRAVEDASIKSIVRMQEDVGLHGITDGELRRGSWHMDFLYQLGGVTKQKCIFGDDFSYLKSVTQGTPKGVPGHAGILEEFVRCVRG